MIPTVIRNLKINNSKMISHSIKLRTSCNLKKLKIYMNRFFDKQLSDSRYIFIQLKLQTENNHIIKIGDFTLLDIKKVKEINSYKKSIEGDAIKYFSRSNEEDKVIKVVIDYVELSRREYKDQILKIISK